MKNEVGFILVRCQRLFDSSYGFYCHRTYHPTRLSALKYMKLSINRLKKLKKFKDAEEVTHMFLCLANVSLVYGKPNYVHPEPYVDY